MIIIFVFVRLQAYIDFEISEGEFNRTRALYERLLDRTKHLKVWISYAKFEASAMREDGGGSELAENDGQEDFLEQKKQCIQNARSKTYAFIFIFVTFFF